MSFFKEFKEFALRGNVMDMAVGIIIGLAFSKIVTSLVNDIIMPPIGYALGDIDFSRLKIDLGQNTADASIRYGIFINTVVDFLIIALCIFVLVKAINSLRKAQAAPPANKNCPECQMTIPINAKRCGHCTSAVG